MYIICPFHAVIDTVIVTSNESKPIRSNGSSVMLTCTVKLSPIIQTKEENVNIEWTGPEFIPESPTTCSTPTMTHSDPVFQCENSTYKSVVIITEFTPGFYNCTATIMVEDLEPYYINMVLSNGTRFTNG